MATPENTATCTICTHDAAHHCPTRTETWCVKVGCDCPGFNPNSKLRIDAWLKTQHVTPEHTSPMTAPTDYAEAARLEALRRCPRPLDDEDDGTRDLGPAFRIGFVQGAHWQREQLAAELQAVRDDLARAIDAPPTDAEVDAAMQSLETLDRVTRDDMRKALTAAKAVRS